MRHRPPRSRHTPAVAPRARFTLATLAILLAPAPAHAATLTLGDAYASRAECAARASTEVTLSWDLGTFTADHLEVLASSSSTCPDTTTAITTGALVDGLGTSQTVYPASGDTAITLADALSAAGISPGTCDGEDQVLYVCVRAITAAGDTAVYASAKLTLQLERPPPPVISDVSPGESALWVTWTAGTAVTGATASSKTYRVFAAANGSTVESGETTATTLRLGGLTNLQTYDVWVIAYSLAGNPSDDSALSAGTPQHVVDFWEAYTTAGGRETGGCEQGGGGALALLVAGFALARTGRRPNPPRAEGAPGPAGGGGRGALS
jgi:hypothetical protein